MKNKKNHSNDEQMNYLITLFMFKILKSNYTYTIREISSSTHNEFYTSS